MYLREPGKITRVRRFLKPYLLYAGVCVCGCVACVCSHSSSCMIVDYVQRNFARAVLRHRDSDSGLARANQNEMFASARAGISRTVTGIHTGIWRTGNHRGTARYANRFRWVRRRLVSRAREKTTKSDILTQKKKHTHTDTHTSGPFSHIYQNPLRWRP